MVWMPESGCVFVQVLNISEHLEWKNYHLGPKEMTWANCFSIVKEKLCFLKNLYNKHAVSG